jgi:hypothetical protein
MLIGYGMMPTCRTALAQQALELVNISRSSAEKVSFRNEFKKNDVLDVNRLSTCQPKTTMNIAKKL